jgi:hypothetical protein
MDCGDLLEQKIEKSDLFHVEDFELTCRKFKSDREQFRYEFPNFGDRPIDYLKPPYDITCKPFSLETIIS